MAKKAAEKDSKKDKKKEEKKTKPAKEEKKTKAAKEDKKKDKKEKLVKKEAKEEKKKKKEEEEPEKTLEEQLEEELTDEEIENFQIDKVDMEKLTNRVCLFLANYDDGIVQSELWKKFKLTSRDGSRLALKLERMGIITREKILENKRWTYVLKIKKTPVSTDSIENAPCLVCPVEQKCSLDGEVSPRTCQWIEEWSINELSKPKKKKEQ
ncbi:helix-turn-helix transcriptional regulator [Candidatus Nitrosotenuis aquarius]|uniref:helix-turn-helix transcriptional regulator n=1 Tax=Candidatus Nitrosotenuis aquarius TaxID=1846278 RepID=UPI000C1E968D|nr:transcriptional regulator [Candidatus Nitrosotenuis aquarius]